MKYKFRNNIYCNVPSPLVGMQSHDLLDGINRIAPEGFPVHIGIHQVSIGESDNSKIYSHPHAHSDEDEINILITDVSMKYRLTFDDESYEVCAPASVWIPAGVKHSANVISGRGTFICVRIKRKKDEVTIPSDDTPQQL